MRKMTRRELITGGAAAAAAVSVLATESCSTSVGGSSALPNAPQVLTVKYADTVLADKIVRTRTYGGTIPGPALRAVPGQTFSVLVDNQLPADPAATPGPGIDPMNNPHLFNTTNLHVHGMQVVPHIFEPIGNSDPNSMMIAIAPGQKKLYSFAVPADQPGGLYWYHPHHHGSTDTTVSGGMAGLILVQGPIDSVPEIAAARDIPLAVQTLQLNPDPAAANRYSIEYQAYKKPSAGGYTPRSSDMFVLANGQLVSHISNLVGFGNATTPPAVTTYQPPQIAMAPGEVVRLRFLNGTNSLLLPLQLPGFDVYVIAYDGVNLLAPQRVDQSTGSIQVPSGGRVELLVRAPQTPGIFTLSALSVTDGQTWPQFNIMGFTVGGTPVAMQIPAALPAPTREYPLISPGELVATRSVTFNNNASTSMLSNTALTVNAKQYDEMAIMFSPMVGTAEKWIITNPMAQGHPFHIHTNSFEVHAVNGTPLAAPYIADTVWVPANGSVEVWTRYKQWRGKAVFHCHKLSHEDQGMMANIMLT